MSKRGPTIINDILAEISKYPGKALHVDRIAKTLRQDPARVRDSLTGFVRNHPGEGVEKVTVGVFRWVDAPEVTQPVSAQPSLPLDELLDASVVRYGDPHGDLQVICDFVIVKQTDELVILEQTDDHSLWVARKL